GDRAARDRAITLAMPMADAMANRYRRRIVEAEDVRQIAYIGLIRAADRYDPQLPRGFLPFAVVTIRGEIRRYFRDRTWSVRVPRGVKARAMAVRAGPASRPARSG